MTDPWVEGDIFNNSWSLLSPTPPTVFDCLANATHVWFSHEHPDHFYPPNVKKFLHGKHFLFQKTKDKRVISYLSGLSDKVTELNFGENYEITKRFNIMVFPFGRLDSYCIIEVGDITILNLNDCYITNDEEINFIQKQCPKVDILFFQFSYAKGNTNKDETEKRRILAANKVSHLIKTIKRFKPTYTCPFASFIYFCNSDNYYLNDAINRIGDVISQIKDLTIPLCFYPGDQWYIGDAVDSSAAIAKYKEDYKRIRPKDYGVTKVSLEQIMGKVQEYLAKTKKNNPLWPFYYYYRPDSFRIKFLLSDLQEMLNFDFKTGVSAGTKTADSVPICELQSDSIMNLFSFDWGYDTLSIGGRYQTNEVGQRRLANIFKFSSKNYQGLFYNVGGIYLTLRDRIIQRPKYLPLR